MAAFYQKITKKTTSQKSLIALALLFVWVGTSAQLCTKAIVHGRDYDTQPKTETYEHNRKTINEAIEKTLDHFGYDIVSKNEEGGNFVAGWKPVTVDSHYFDLFGRKDYGLSDGAYYKLLVDIIPQGQRMKVAVATTVKSVSGKLNSSGKLEKKFIKQLSAYLRSPQIEMTNVGVTEKK